LLFFEVARMESGLGSTGMTRRRTGGGGGLMSDRLKAFDAYPKAATEDHLKRTAEGGAITLAAAILMAVLFLSELWNYLGTSVSSKISVDVSRSEKMVVSFDIEFPHLACAVVEMVAMDVMGENVLDVHDEHIRKQRLDAHGRVVAADYKEENALGAKAGSAIDSGKDSTPDCGSCYGAAKEGECCNTCDEVKEAYRKVGWSLTFTQVEIAQCRAEELLRQYEVQEGEGCRVKGYMEVNKVSGNLHFAPGMSFAIGRTHVFHDLSPFGPGASFNVSHNIHEFRFGPVCPQKSLCVEPLSGARNHHAVGHGAFQYFMKVVPTVYRTRWGRELRTSQYSSTEKFVAFMPNDPEPGVPGLFFFYEPNPFVVEMQEGEGKSFFRFICNMCAVLGGIFTISGLVDGAVFRGMKALRKGRRLVV